MKLNKEQREHKQAYLQFKGLCDNYPNIHFIGNCAFDLTKLKKDISFLHTEDLRKSLLMDGDNCFFYRNSFMGKIDEN